MNPELLQQDEFVNVCKQYTYVAIIMCFKHTFQNVVDVYSNLLDENNEPGYMQVIHILVGWLSHLCTTQCKTLYRQMLCRVRWYSRHQRDLPF